MQRDITLYDILEVSPQASPQVIRAAYRCLAQVNHPDKKAGSDAASERQTQINHAYSVLSDPVKRQCYDQSVKLHPYLGERRGSGAGPPDHADPVVVEQPVSRPFVFRPLT